MEFVYLSIIDTVELFGSNYNYMMAPPWKYLLNELFNRYVQSRLASRLL